VPALLPFHLLDLTLVGADVEEDGKAEVCDRFSADLYPKQYSEFLVSEAAKQLPDLAIAFNPGMGGDPSRWDFSVDTLLRSRAPFLITACSEVDYQADMAYLEAKGAKVVMQPRANPFASKMVEVALRQGEQQVVHANSWWWAVKGVH